MTTLQDRAQALNTAQQILRELCDLPAVPQELKARAQVALSHLQALPDGDETPKGLTWWIQVESESNSRTALVADGNAITAGACPSPSIWTTVCQTREPDDLEVTLVLIAYAPGAHAARAAFAEEFGTHCANQASAYPGIFVNDLTAPTIEQDALRMMKELVRRRAPFSFHARWEHRHPSAHGQR